MRIEKPQNISENEQGSALVYTLMVLLLLSLLGMSVGMVTVGSYRLASETQDSTSAYYIAEAGAETIYRNIESQVSKVYESSSTKNAYVSAINTLVRSVDDKIVENFQNQKNSQPEAHVKIEQTGEMKYIIISTGKVSGNERVVKKEFNINWIEKSKAINLPSTPPNAAIVARNKLSLTNGTLNGTAYIDSKAKNAIFLKGGQGGYAGTIVYPLGVKQEDILDKSQIYEPYPKLISREEKFYWNNYEDLLNAIKKDFNQPVTINKNTFERLPEEYFEKDQYNKYQVVTSDGSVLVNNWMFSHYDIKVNNNKYIPKLILDSDKSTNITFSSGAESLVIDEISIGSGSKVFLKGSGNINIYLNKLTIQPAGSLDIEVDGHVTIRVDDLKVLSSKINIKNSNNVTIVVNKSLEFNNESMINNPGSSKQLLFVYRGSTPNFSELTYMNANVFSINNSDALTIKNSSINGIFVTDSKSVSYSGGNASRESNLIMIAPAADITLGEGYYINGTLIGNKVTLSGGGNLMSKIIDSAGFYFDGGAENEAIDLITSTPIIEPN
ncbi:hypothetical protein G7058_08865 [Jeotgalibaca porci]|uniref:Uncharacterized protein n=1 Tax=Jeotgalibaca porci TaxID=1868793 RepID=A0A6G7WIN0_9LACT|nr:PilX N-terminal domain-containing pilus assembly protein [Jeotgalibaca porci]QIK52134.1 hypothetical protein G7058_08865 [Jeotgalibaca porci]